QCCTLHLGQIAQLLDKTPKILGFHRVLSLVRITRRVSPYIKSKQSLNSWHVVSPRSIENKGSHMPSLY
ncbi:MAG: hypothetical protein KJ587_13405, partial [Alphaproteobacteria bacterium]|nr:hypothetical protein [Alphaproteobacteria bacterium]